MSFFVTGTDTNAGKTYATALLIRALRKQGIDCVGMKPICCGVRDDAETLHLASAGAAPLNDVNPVWLRTPAAPYVAAMVENRPIDLDLIRAGFASLQAAHSSVVVEGVGGWMVPIAQDYFVSDLVKDLKLPVLVVVANRLGALNHAVLTVRAIRAEGLECLGVILNEAVPAPEEESVAVTTNRAVLEAVLDARVLLEIPHGATDLELDAELLWLLTGTQAA